PAGRPGADQRGRRGGGVSGLIGEGGLVEPTGCSEPGRKGALTARTATRTPTITSSRSPAASDQVAPQIPWASLSERRRIPAAAATASAAPSRRAAPASARPGAPELASSALT